MTTQTLNGFQALIEDVRNDETRLRAFAEVATDAKGLAAFAAANGHPIPAREAERIFDAARHMVVARQASLSDEQLDAVAGGISFAAIGAIGGGVAGAGFFAGAILSVLAAPVTGGGSLAAFMALSGSGMAALVGGAAAAGTVGAAAGAVAGAIADNS